MHGPPLPPLDSVEIVDQRTKGIPGGIEPFPLGDIGAKGWNVLAGDLPLPVAVLKLSALNHNSRWMTEFLNHWGVAICPHGKTSMSPQLFARPDRGRRLGNYGGNREPVAGVPRPRVPSRTAGQSACRSASDPLRGRRTGHGFQLRISLSRGFRGRGEPDRRGRAEIGRRPGRSRSCSKADTRAAGPDAGTWKRPSPSQSR